MPKSWRELKSAGAVDAPVGQKRPKAYNLSRIRRARRKYYDWMNRRDRTKAFNRDQYIASQINPSY